MKKIYLSIAFLFVCLFSINRSSAAQFTISVANFQFTPSVVNCSVGDSIIWVWVSGTHTTTSTSVPAGATPWDESIAQSSPGFLYIVSIAGTYDFVCNFHPSMVGQIVVTGTSGIQAPQLTTNFNVSTIRPSVYNVNYSISKLSNVKISLFDITGKMVKMLATSTQNAGDYTETYYLNDLMKGIYLFEMIADNQRFIKRITVE